MEMSKKCIFCGSGNVKVVMSFIWTCNDCDRYMSAELMTEGVSIYYLDIKGATINTLRDNGIKTLKDIKDFLDTGKYLIDLENIGVEKQEEIEQAIRKYRRAKEGERI